MGRELYDEAQGKGSLFDRIMQDHQIRLHQRPRTPPVPTLTTDSRVESDGGTTASVSVAWSPERRGMDRIIRWKRSDQSTYTEEPGRRSPHIIRPVATGVGIDVSISSERRQTGARSPYSDDVSVTAAGDTTAPATPTGLACSSDPASGTIFLNWNPNTESDLVYYTVHRDTTSPALTEQGRVVGTSFPDFNSTPGVRYYYRIRAVDRSGNTSGYSNETNCTVKFIGTIPVTPAKTSVITLSSAFAQAISQAVNIPAGSQILTVPVSVISNTLSGSPSVVVRFSVGSSGSNISGEQQFNFAAGSETRQGLLISAANLSVSGQTNILYEWRVINGSFSGQLTSAGSIEVS